MGRPKKRRRKAKWLREAKRGPVDTNVLEGAQIVGLLHPHTDRVGPLLTRIAVFTGKMLRKNRKEHPEMDASYNSLPQLLRHPDAIAKDPDDPQVAIFYGEISGALFRATVCLSDDPEKRANSVFSYRKCRYPELLSNAQGGYIVSEPSEAG